jgi:hypothetical protein
VLNSIAADDISLVILFIRFTSEGIPPMTVLALTLNKQATSLLGSNTRLRLKSLTRGGQAYLALRPSYRVSGKNTKVMVALRDGGTSEVQIDDADVAAAGAPALEIGTTYKLVDVGYGWFTVKALEAEDQTEETFTVSEYQAPQASDTHEITKTNDVIVKEVSGDASQEPSAA